MMTDELSGEMEESPIIYTNSVSLQGGPAKKRPRADQAGLSQPWQVGYSVALSRADDISGRASYIRSRGPAAANGRGRGPYCGARGRGSYGGGGNGGATYEPGYERSCCS